MSGRGSVASGRLTPPALVQPTPRSGGAANSVAVTSAAAATAAATAAGHHVATATATAAAVRATTHGTTHGRGCVLKLRNGILLLLLLL